MSHILTIGQQPSRRSCILVNKCIRYICGIQYTSMVSLSQERHQLFGTSSTEESYQAGSRTEEAGVCRPSKRAGINNIGKETCQG